MWYALDLTPDGDTLLVTSPDFPEVTSFGATRDDALQRGRLAIEEAIAGRMADALDIPPPRPVPGPGPSVDLALLSVLKAGLYMQLRARGLTRADLMRRLGWQREQVDRLFRLTHKSTLQQIEAAYKALGAELRVDGCFPDERAA
jgi:antitoxin HicB